MPSPPKFKDSPVEFDQHLLFPTNVFDLLPKDHDCYIYEAIFQSIDTSEVEKQYHHLGQHAYPPKLIIAILIYAYSHGVFSSREIEKRCRQDLAFMYISQMNCPNFRVLGDFRKNNLSFFHDCFKQSVKMAMELQLASLGHISLDGSKFKANPNISQKCNKLRSNRSILTFPEACCFTAHEKGITNQPSHELGRFLLKSCFSGQQGSPTLFQLVAILVWLNL